MKLVIDIPDYYDISKIMNGSVASKMILHAVEVGTPLEKVLREIRGEVVKKMVDYNNTVAVTIDCAALDILDKHISGKE